MDAPTMHNSLTTMPFRKTKVDAPKDILCLPDGKRIIVHSYDGSFRVRDLETGIQVGEEWEDKDFRVETTALSPDGKKVAGGSFDGAVKLWSVDTGKVIKTWTGHTDEVTSMSWSPDGGRVVSGSRDETFGVWDVDSGKTILGPIKAMEDGLGVQVVCYSPDAKMIATAGYTYRGSLKIWDANSGKLLKTFDGGFECLAWTLDGKTLIADGSKFDTATWAKVDLCEDYVISISVSPNDHILATTSYSKNTAQLWDLETSQPIGIPLYHPDVMNSATFSVDGKFLLTCCDDDHIYTWDVSAIVKEAGLPSDVVDVTPRPAPKIKGARVAPGFFDDALREANLRIRLSQSHAPPTLTPHQRTFNPFTSVSRSSKPHGATESATQSHSRPFSWTRNLSGLLRRRDRSDVQLREVEVPCTAGQPVRFFTLVLLRH
ncbi:WD40 repeat-like protein [Suillus brevipes Sb2]|nr:WD40 repeat-like protein [Suillus brevipes Sb2]